MGDEKDIKTEEKATSKSFLDILLEYKWVFLLIIVLAITVMVRIEPMKLVPLEKNAEAGLKNAVMTQIKDDINNQYPNLPDAQKTEMVQKEFEKLKATKEYQDQLEQGKKAVKEKFQYESGGETYVYLGDIDSYYWLRQARNIIEKGDQCDLKEDGICYDTYTTAPVPRGKAFDFYPIFIVNIYKFLKIFEPDMSLMQASFLTPLILSLFIVLLVFFLLKRVAGDFAAFVGALLVNVNPYVLSRSLGSDSDILNVLFQALFLFLAVECFYAKKPLWKYILAGLTGASLVIYSLFWPGWWYLADLFIMALLLYGSYLIIKHWYYDPEKKIKIMDLKKPLINIMLLLIIFCAVVGIGFSVAKSPTQLYGVVFNQFSVFNFKVASNTNYWPNVLTTVAEFNSISMPSIISSFGTSFAIPIFLMAILGIVLLVFPNAKIISRNWMTFALLVIFNVIIYLILKSGSSSILLIFFILLALIGVFIFTRIKSESDLDSGFILVITLLVLTFNMVPSSHMIFFIVLPIIILGGAAFFFINKDIIRSLLFLIFSIAFYAILLSGLMIFMFVIPLIFGMYIHLKTKEEEFYPDMVFLLSIMICLIAYFTTTGVRFLFLMVIPVCIFAAVFLSKTATILVNMARKSLSLPKTYNQIFIFLILALFLIAPVKAGFQTAQEYVPQVTDEWVATLEKINKESKPDAIINSWWDFGHWFKYLADRRVTLDGSSQNSPQLHWLGKLLLTSDEKTSIGILRMLDCGGNNAFDEINNKMNDTPHSVDIVNKIIIVNKQNATEILKGHGFSDTEVSDVLQYTHCDAPEDFLIASEDMIGKSGVWAHFGSWNFKRSYLSSVVNTMPEEEIITKFKDDYEMTPEQTRQWISELKALKNEDEINVWIAAWPGYYSTSLSKCTNKGNISVCTFSRQDMKISIEVDFDKMEMNIKQQDAVYHPRRAAFIYNDTFQSLTYLQNPVDIGVVAQKRGDEVTVLFTSPELAGSMFTRLFFFDGAGLNNFEKFYDTTTVYGDRIITWKVVWPDE